MSEKLLPVLVGVFGVAAGSFGAWARLTNVSVDAGPVPERIARVAFEVDDVDDAPSIADAAIDTAVDTGGYTARRVALVRAVDFQGEGAEDLVEFLATRRASGLGGCYADEAPHSVVLRLGSKVEVLEADPDARACLQAALKAWPWPDDARGLVSIDLQTALLL